MSKRKTDQAVLGQMVETLEQYEAERTLASLKSGSQFDAGIVEGISTAIDKLDAAKSDVELQTVVQELSGLAGTAGQEEDAYARGIAAAAGHVAGVVSEELAAMPETDF
ncbi:MAG: hypothetical protein E6X17_06145 [Sporomusaceae bacterium]|nr:hypothetical protein [Sporomusaceae bacterium]